MSVHSQVSCTLDGCEIRSQLETMGNHDLLVFTGESSL